MTMRFASTLLLLSASRAFATQELDEESFNELTTSGKNGMIKFFQPWCGHCTKMKPDWDRLAEEAHSSVFIADINCSDQEDLCHENDVSGYPTIKVYKDGEVEKYSGPRSFSGLMEFVDEELASKCDISKAAESCSEKAQEYITKWQGKAKDDSSLVAKELSRLEGLMSKSKMEKNLKLWLRERLMILKQISPEEGI